MPSYSVSLNAVVSPTGGSVARLDAVCAAGPTSNYVVVASAANLAVAGGRFRGVALEAASGNQAVQIVDFGTIDLLTTVLSGTGEYVSVNATGQLERTASFTSATIGTLENGTVHVNVALSLGGAVTGNATAIQGVSVSATPAAARGNILAHNGTDWRPRPADSLNLMDYGATGDGTTDDSTAIELWIAAMAAQKRSGYAPPGNYRFTRRLKFWFDTPRGFFAGVEVHGSSAWALASTLDSWFLADIPGIAGETATISKVTNTLIDGGAAPGDGQIMTTITGTGIVGTEDIIGLRLVLWGAATEANNSGSVGFIITARSADSITFFNPSGVTADANNGALHWRVDTVGFDIRAHNTVWSGIGVRPAPSARIGAAVLVTEAPGANATVLTQVLFERCSFSSASYATARLRHGVVLMQSIVPESGNTHYTLNTGGVPHTYDPLQGDSIHFDRCALVGAEESQISHQSLTGQSVLCKLTKCLMGGFTLGCGCYSAPAGSYPKAAGGTGSFNGTVIIEECELGPCYDFAVQLGASGRDHRISGNYVESAGAFLHDPGTSGAPQALLLLANDITLPSTTYTHPLKEVIRVGHEGPVSIISGQIVQSDADSYHIAMRGALTNAQLVLLGVSFFGETAWQGKRGEISASAKGPLAMDLTEVLQFKVDAGATQTINFTSADFTAAGITVNQEEVTFPQIARVIRQQLTGGTAYGSHDQRVLRVLTNTNGGGGAIQCLAGTFQALLGFTTVNQTGATRSQLSTDTKGLVDTHRQAGNQVSLVSFGCSYWKSGTASFLAFPQGIRQYGNTSQYGTIYSTPTDAFTAATGTTTGGRTVTVAGAVITIADVRTTATSHLDLAATNALGAALLQGGWYVSARTAGTSFAVTFTAAIAGTETLTYSLSEGT